MKTKDKPSAVSRKNAKEVSKVAAPGRGAKSPNRIIKGKEQPVPTISLQTADSNNQNGKKIHGASGII